MTKNKYSNDFEEFWGAYPSFQSNPKYKASLAWDKALKIEEAEIITDGASRYKAYLQNEWKKNGNRDYPSAAHASTWLNARRWEDFAAPEQRQPVSCNPIVNTTSMPARVALSRLASEIGAPAFNSWFGNVGVYSMDLKGGVILTAPSTFIRDHIKTHYAERLSTFFGKNVDVVHRTLENVSRETKEG